MEVMLPPPSTDFNFDSTCSSPYAPSSPKRFGQFYYSAPSSPNRASAFYRDFNSFSFINRGSSVIPYDWEEVPGTPKFQNLRENEENNKQEAEEDKIGDFEFGFSGQVDDDTASLTADELFDGGKIKPLKPPPRLDVNHDFGFRKSPGSSPKSPIALVRRAFSPKKKKAVDPFEVAMEQSSKQTYIELPQQRGRAISYSSTSRKGSRSLSPYRSPHFEQQPEPQQQQPQQRQRENAKPTSASKSSSKKWSFRDLLLFRSASEGRASDRDPLRKYSLVSRRSDTGKNSSFRSNDGSGSGKRGRVSAHELHYKSNRAVTEEMKRKTFLPYKQGLFGWFRI